MFTRVRKEEGFGLIELIMAMTVLNVGILAIVAAFNSGIVAINRSSQISTASALADQQMELYRGLAYTTILLTSGTIPGVAPYTTDTAYVAPEVMGTCTVTANACNASRTVTGADRKPYRVDTYIVMSQACPTHLNCPTTPWTPEPNGRPVKIITVVVRNALTSTTLSARALARVVSTFDASTG